MTGTTENSRFSPLRFLLHLTSRQMKLIYFFTKVFHPRCARRLNTRFLKPTRRPPRPHRSQACLVTLRTNLMWMIQTTWILPRTRIKISTPRVSTALDALANQLRDQIQALKAEQETMLRELSTMTPMTPRRDSTHPKRCFICDLPDAHVIGPRNCPEVPILINEGLSSFNQVGRLMRPDDSDLPYGVHGGSGVAKALHDEHVTVLSAATSNSSSFQYSDPDPIEDNYYMPYSSPAESLSSSEMCSQPMDLPESFSRVRSTSSTPTQRVSQTVSPSAPQRVLPSPSYDGSQFYTSTSTSTSPDRPRL